MKPTADAPLRPRHLAALAAGLAFAAGAAVALGGYGQRFGFDGALAFGVLVVLADLWLLIRAVTGSLPRPGALRTAARAAAWLLSVAGPVLLVVLAYVPIFLRAAHDDPDRALLALAGLLLVPVLVCAATVGGRVISRSGTRPDQPAPPPP